MCVWHVCVACLVCVARVCGVCVCCACGVCVGGVACVWHACVCGSVCVVCVWRVCVWRVCVWRVWCVLYVCVCVPLLSPPPGLQPCSLAGEEAGSGLPRPLLCCLRGSGLAGDGAQHGLPVSSLQKVPQTNVGSFFYDSHQLTDWRHSSFFNTKREKVNHVSFCKFTSQERKMPHCLGLHRTSLAGLLKNLASTLK